MQAIGSDKTLGGDGALRPVINFYCSRQDDPDTKIRPTVGNEKGRAHARPSSDTGASLVVRQEHDAIDIADADHPNQFIAFCDRDAAQVPQTHIGSGLEHWIVR